MDRVTVGKPLNIAQAQHLMILHQRTHTGKSSIYVSSVEKLSGHIFFLIQHKRTQSRELENTSTEALENIGHQEYSH